MTDTERKQAAAAKIRALLSKTIENGATESEALAAMAKAQELMQKYGIERDEAAYLDEGFETAAISAKSAMRI